MLLNGTLISTLMRIYPRQLSKKIVVNENSFDWYLHFSGDDKTPKTCNVEGDKKPIKSSFLGHLMRLRWWRAAQAAIAEGK